MNSEIVNNEIITVTAYIQSELEKDTFFNSIDKNKAIAEKFVKTFESHKVNWDCKNRCFETEIEAFYIYHKFLKKS